MMLERMAARAHDRGDETVRGHFVRRAEAARNHGVEIRRVLGLMPTIAETAGMVE